jgi:hypothetical protein
MTAAVVSETPRHYSLILNDEFVTRRVKLSIKCYESPASAVDEINHPSDFILKVGAHGVNKEACNLAPSSV